jgi:hypothetical protein
VASSRSPGRRSPLPARSERAGAVGLGVRVASSRSSGRRLPIADCRLPAAVRAVGPGVSIAGAWNQRPSLAEPARSLSRDWGGSLTAGRLPGVPRRGLQRCVFSRCSPTGPARRRALAPPRSSLRRPLNRHADIRTHDRLHRKRYRTMFDIARPVWCPASLRISAARPPRDQGSSRHRRGSARKRGCAASARRGRRRA